MAIKESSDELNPPVITTGSHIVRASGSKSAGDYVALALSTWGVGYVPLMPGTLGSALGVGLYLALYELSIRAAHLFSPASAQFFGMVETFHMALVLAVIICITGIGIWAGSRAEKLFGRKDPGRVVIDEIAGQLVTFLFIPLILGLTWWILVAGFLLFRLFDIWKPYPIRRLEVLESGLGIMADDLLAGLYAGSMLTVVVLLAYHLNVPF